MRVVHYHPSMLGGESGPATAARGWAAATRRVGVPVVAVVDRAAVRLPPPEGVGCVALSHQGRGAGRVPVGLADVLDRDDVLVVHGGWVARNVLAGRAAARRSIPLVVNAHGAYDPHVFGSRRLAKRLWAAGLERRLLGRALAVHLFFAEERAGLARLGVSARAVVAPNGIDAPEARWDGGSGGYVAWLGRYAPHTKGLDLLLRAVHALAPDERPRLRLHGPDWRGHRAGVRSSVAALGLDPWVVVGGPIHGAEKWELLSRATACVYPSRWEGCSLAVLEAIAVGVPTLVTPYPMGRSLAADGAALEAGWSPDEIADGLRRIASPDGAAIGARGAEVARSRFAWTAVARSWLDQVAALGPGG